MKKIRKVQVVRLVVQIISLVLIPGIFTLTFSELGQIYSMIAKGNFNFIEMFPKLIEVFTVIPITILLGRFFCGWFCAFGLFNDIIYMISSKLFKIKFKINREVDSVLKYLKYVILLLIIYLAWVKGSRIFDSASPWNAFAQLGDLSQGFSQYAVGFVVLALIAIGAAFVERFFCRYLCPLGAIFALISRFRLFNIDKPTDHCGKCIMCTNNCSMGIELYKVQSVESGECINCFKCVEVCPRKNAQASIIDTNINPALASAAAIAAFAGLYSVSNMIGGTISDRRSAESFNNDTNISSNNNYAYANSNSSVSTDPSTANNTDNSGNSLQGKYTDGTYTGTGRGHRQGLQVSVTIKNNKITDVEIVSDNETPRYSSEPFNTIPQEIMQAQSANVDAVSGATESSDGIMMAVQDALSQAAVKS